MTSDKKFEATVQLENITLNERLVNTSRRKACLIFVGGLDVGKVVHVDRKNLVFGRDPMCDIILQDDGISRQHIKVSRMGDSKLFIQDLGSTNGTYVGGERIREVTLGSGDKVLVGRRTIMKFELQDEIDLTFQRQMYESSTLDGLTGIYNRKYFNQRLLAELSFTRRHGLPISLIMFDIDHFKQVNDTYGHPVGDAVLIKISKAIGEMIRQEDVFARYGGEEFAVIATGIGDEGATAFGERIRAKVHEQKTAIPQQPGKGLRVTVSVGVATILPEIALRQTVTVAPELIITAADKNLYEAKENGRNQVRSTSMIMG